MATVDFTLNDIQKLIHDALLDERKHTQALVRDSALEERTHTEQLLRDSLLQERKYTKELIYTSALEQRKYTEALVHSSALEERKHTRRSIDESGRTLIQNERELTRAMIRQELSGETGSLTGRLTSLSLAVGQNSKDIAEIKALLSSAA